MMNDEITPDRWPHLRALDPKLAEGLDRIAHRVDPDKLAQLRERSRAVHREWSDYNNSEMIRPGFDPDDE